MQPFYCYEINLKAVSIWLYTTVQFLNKGRETFWHIFLAKLIYFDMNVDHDS